MGFLTRAFVPRSVRRATHPVRAVKRAATPRTVKKVRRAMSPIDNAIYGVERKLMTKPRKRAGTPRSSSGSGSGQSAQLTAPSLDFLGSEDARDAMAAKDLVVPQIKLVESEHLTLNPGQSTYDVDPNNFQANYPAGYTVIGTGFNSVIGNADLVQSYGTSVGGFIHNDTSVQLTGVYVQAICGVVPGGASAAAAHPSSEAAYHATLQRLAALHR